MAQFFKATPGTFIDTIYRPDKEMELALAQQQVEHDLLRTKLLDDAPDINFDYWDYNKEAVAKKKQELKDRINAITTGMYENPENAKQYMRDMKALSRELIEDFTKGDIYKFQKNAENVREFNKKLEALPNAQDREAYKKHFDFYKERNPDGTINEIFEPIDLYNSRNLDTDFLGSTAFKELQATIDGTLNFDHKNGWVITRKNGVKELANDRIQEAFKQFIQSQPDVLGRARHGARYFGEDNWVDENNNLRFDEESYLGDMMRRLGKTYSYKQETVDGNKQANPYALQAMKNSGSGNKREKEPHEYWQIDMSKEIKQAPGTTFNRWVQAGMNNLRELVKKTGGNESLLFKNVENFGDLLKNMTNIETNNPNLKDSPEWQTLIKAARSYQYIYTHNLNASFDQLRQMYGYSDEQIKGVYERGKQLINDGATSNIAGKLYMDNNTDKDVLEELGIASPVPGKTDSKGDVFYKQDAKFGNVSMNNLVKHVARINDRIKKQDKYKNTAEKDIPLWTVEFGEQFAPMILDPTDPRYAQMVYIVRFRKGGEEYVFNYSIPFSKLGITNKMTNSNMNN